MQTRPIRLRFRRRLRRGQRQVEDLGTQAEQQIEQHLFKRFERLLPVRRFVIGWVALLLLLILGVVGQNFALSNYYQTLQPVPGGIYSEGVKGRFTNANPMYATNDADQTVSRLLFAGLFTYGQSGKLIGDLASGYEVDNHGSTYTVHLRSNLKWHDGQPLTSADVLFTYQAIQNPDAKSPLQSNWNGITITAPDSHTVVFKLPSALASFPYNLTNGIVPKHILGRVAPSDLRSVDFNTTHPVGAGPFAWQAVDVQGDGNPNHAREQVTLVPYADYHAGKPKLQKFIVQVYADQEQLIQDFRKHSLTGMEGVNHMPEDLKRKTTVMQHNLTLRAANMVFFKTSTGVLADQQVRKALVQAADVPKLIDQLDYPVRQVKEPLLVGQLGYDSSLTQAGFDLTAAKDQLTASGWQAGKGGIRYKDGKPLNFTLTASDTADNHAIVKQLQQQWRALGVQLKVEYLATSDFQGALSGHTYDAIINGIAIGVDPDVYVYWDSSQADIRSANRLNFSEYNNKTADAALEAGRTRLDPTLRTIKYKPFLEAWRQDNPALGLYQPRILYATNGTVAGLNDVAINTASDRFNNVHNWQIRQAKVTN